MSSTPPLPIPHKASSTSSLINERQPNSYHGETMISTTTTSTSSTLKEQYKHHRHQRSSSTDSTPIPVPTTTTTTSATTTTTNITSTTHITKTTNEKDKEKQEIESLIKLYSSNNNLKIESWTAINHLFKHLMTPGIVDFLCNKLYTLEDQDIDFFITQLCIMLINQPNDQRTVLSSLAKFVLDRCAKSMRFAIKSYWIFQAFEEDGQKNILNIETNAHYHQQQQQQHAQNQHHLQQISSPSTSPSKNANGHSTSPSSSLLLRRVVSDDHLERDHKHNENNNQTDNHSTTNNNNNNHTTDTTKVSSSTNHSSSTVNNQSNGFPTTKIFINGEMFSPMMENGHNNHHQNNHDHGNHNVGHNTSTSSSFIRTPSTFELIEAKKELATRLREYCEMSVITCSRPLITRPRTSSLPSPVLGYSLPNLPPPSSSSTSSQPKQQLELPPGEEQATMTTIISTKISDDDEKHSSNNTSDSSPSTSSSEIIISTSNIISTPTTPTMASQQLLGDPVQTSKTPPIESSQPDYDFEFEISKSYRCDYLNSILSFVQTLSNISKKLISVPIDLRQAKLKDEISILNINLPLGLYLPMGQESRHHCIVRIPPEEVKILNSRERVPFLLVLEMIEGEEEASAANILNIVSSYLPFTVNNSSIVNNNNRNTLKLDLIKKHMRNNSANKNDQQPKKTITTDSTNNITTTTTPPTITTIINPPTPISTPIPNTNTTNNTTPTTTHTHTPIHFNNNPFGELWEHKMERYRKISPYGELPSWKMVSVIIKTGDDCRQEQMAVQLIRKFQEIWNDAKLPLYLRPYDILVTSSQSGIIETIPDTVSLHNLKKNTPNFTTLLAYFKSQYGEPHTEAFRAAQAKFVESLAAYSIVTYLLQVKDRHNGNIMLDKEGHIIHIDFGFILSNSPGNMSFESAPFKLTQDWVDVIGGSAQSPMFLYFQALCVRGFLEARKHFDKFVSFIELMMTGPRMSCFQGGRDFVIDQLKQRFFLDMTERECGNHVEQLITYSLDHRATRYYDYYQYYYNSIYA